MDIAIIGAGPVGLFAAFQAGLLGMKACMIDALDFAGGQCAALYPDKPIYDIPAHPSILASDLVANLEKQAKHFKPEFHLGAQITNLERKPDQEGFVLHTSNGRTIKTKTVLIAAGSGLFTPNKPKLEGLEKHEDKSIFYSVRDKSHFKDKKVIIFGGGDSALDWCIEFVDFASHVTLVHRRDKFSCLDSSLEKAEALQQAGKLNIFVSHQLTQLKEDEETGSLKHLVIEDSTGNTKELATDTALFFFGVSIALGPIAAWNLDLERRLIKVNTVDMCTNIPGIYAAGDIVSYQGKLKLISVGFAEAAIACHAIKKHLNPDKPNLLVHSTSQSELFNART